MPKHRELYPVNCPLKTPMLSKLLGRECLEECLGPVKIRAIVGSGRDFTTPQYIISDNEVNLCGAADPEDQRLPGENFVILPGSPEHTQLVNLHEAYKETGE